MKKFSKNTKTKHDLLLENFSVESGLPIDSCKKIYESFGDKNLFESAITDTLLKTGLKTFNSCLETLIGILKETAPEALNDVLIKFLGTTAKDDSISFFKILLYLLFMKDQTNFSNIAEKMDIDTKIAGFIKTKSVNLFESVGLPSDVFQTMEPNTVPVITGFNQGCSLEKNLEFYNSLTQLLSRNNKRWGNNYHLTNVYEAIQKYIQQQAEYLKHKDTMHQVDGNFEDDILKQLFLGTLPVMYRDINVLRPMIADIQTFTFDMVCIFMGYVKHNQQYMKYLNRDTLNRMITAFSEVFGKLYSSTKTSHVLRFDTYQDGTNNDKPDIQLIEIYKNVYLKHDYNNMYLSLSLTGLADILYIIKSCSQDFEIRLRPCLREFVTAGFEFLARFERIYCEIIKSNKYKNPAMY